MIDGKVARKTNNANEFRARHDTIADFIFLTVSLIKLLQILYSNMVWEWKEI